MKHFKTYIVEKNLDDFEEDVLKNTNREETMKTFKQHIKEAASGDETIGVGSADTHQAPIEDSSMGVHNIENADVLKRVNAFVGSIAEREYLSPQHAVDQLKEKLARIGLDVGEIDLNGDNGKVTAEIKQFGGRFGKDIDGADINDDGISHRKEGGLKLEVTYETLKTGSSKVYAKLV